MVFESLSEKLQSALGKLKGKGKISEKDLDLAMREVRLALLEADVNFKVVKDFVKTVKERALGSEVMESLTPGQQVIKIVNDELTRLMGEKESKPLEQSITGLTELHDKLEGVPLCSLEERLLGSGHDLEVLITVTKKHTVSRISSSTGAVVQIGRASCRERV